MGNDCEICTGWKKPHFFKVLLESCREQLRIPPAFAHHVKKESSYATLESEAVKNWRVKLAADRDGLLFKNGWKEFFEHHVLRVGDFLLFRYNGNMHFTVQVFGRSCCEDSYVFTDEHEKVPEAFRRPVRLLARKPEEKQRPSCSNDKTMKQPHLKHEVKSTIFAQSIKGNPSFQSVLKKGGKYIRSFLYIPQEFVRRNMVVNLLGCQSVAITLRNITDPTVGTCKVRIVARKDKRCRFTGYRISAGWMTFCRKSKLNYGDTCIFEVNNKRSGFDVYVICSSLNRNSSIGIQTSKHPTMHINVDNQHPNVLTAVH
ncbi:unnamed protein product [Victoria cruziana]